MAKWANDSMMDAALAYVADNGDRLDVCSGQPANYAGIAAVTLATVALTAGAGNGDYTLANGDTNGRKLTVAAQSGLSVTASDTATHIAISDGSATLLYVTTCTSQALTSGNTVNVPAFDIEIADPS
ncbi:MAG: hypothetical protein BroJett011_62860 [Chloroflexota bacterium]|nr:MAG: hypothetical protein BroJett011_62860 [Chloroflexota bacterium]